MRNIGPILFAQLGLESVESQTETAPQRGKAEMHSGSDFEAVLTKQLGQVQKSQEPKGEPERKAISQEKQPKKDAAHMISLASVFAPATEQNIPLDVTEKAEVTITVAVTEPQQVRLTAETVSAQPFEHRKQAGEMAVKPTEPLVSEEVLGQVVSRLPERTVTVEPILAEILPEPVPTGAEQGTQAKPELRQARIPGSMPLELEQIKAVEAKPPNVEPTDLRTEFDSQAAHGVELFSSELGAPSQGLSLVRNALEVQLKPLRVKDRQSLPGENTAARGEEQTIMHPELLVTANAEALGNIQESEQIVVEEWVRTGISPETAVTQPPATDDVEDSVWENPRATVGETAQVGETREVPEDQATVPETQEDVHLAPVTAREKSSRLESPRGKFTDEARTDLKAPIRERSAQVEDEMVSPADLKPFEADVEGAKVETPIREVLDFADKENLFPKLVQTMETIVQEERTEVRIQLKPDHLGELKIKLSMERGIMMAEFVVESQAVREVIASQLPQLQTALQNHGTQISDVSVSIGFGNERSEEQGHSSPRQPGRNAQRRLAKMSASGHDKAYLGRSIWNQVDVRV